MNHIYRLIRNRRTGQWVAAAETARAAQGNPGSATLKANNHSEGRFFSALLGMAALASAGTAWSQATPTVVLQAGQAAQAYVAPNARTTVVDINTPSAHGLSHNVYSTYNVNTHGLVLNNAHTRMGLTVDTALAGQLLINGNLNVPATTILNEVVGGNRSLLNGFTEVAGTRAAVVVANPNGITCNGCGFINTTRALLTTGVPTVSFGQLTGLNVTRGDITITGAGLNARGGASDGSDAVPLLNLLSRNIAVDGDLHAKALDIRTGAQAYALDGNLHITGSTAVAGQGSAPTWAIDASVLGGMYADSIRLVANESGVGVRMRGDVAANIDDFVLTAAGKVELRGKISAVQDLTVSTISPASANPGTGVMEDAALSLQNASLTAGRDLSVGATGEIWLEGGQLYASRDAALVAGSLTDRALPSSGQDGNQRFANRNLTIDASNVVDVGGTHWSAGQDLNLTASAIRATAANTRIGADTVALRSRSADIELGQSQVQAASSLMVNAARHLIVDQGAGQGIEVTDGNLDITVGQVFVNAGSLQASHQSSIRAGSIDNSGTLVLSRERTQDADDHLITTGNVLNQTSGRILSAGRIRYDLGDGGDLTNRGLLQSTGGTVISARHLVQDATGRTLASTAPSETDTDLASAITLSQDMTNSGLVQVGRSLDVSARNITQSVSSAALLGAMSGTGAMSVNLSAAYDGGGGNRGTVFSGTDLTVTAPSMINLDTGLWGANQDLSLVATSGSITNQGGTWYAGRDLHAVAAGDIRNHITHHTVQGELLGNRNGASAHDATPSAAGGLYATTQVLDSSGTVNAGRDITFTSSTIVNSADVNAGRDITFTADTILNQVQGGDTRVWSGSGIENDSASSAAGLDYTLTISGPGDYYIFPDGYFDATYTETWHRVQHFAGGTPVFKPKLKAVGTVTLRDFSVGKNLGGLIEADAIQIVTTKSGASFVNDTLALAREDFRRVNRHEVHYVAMGPGEYSNVWTSSGTSKTESSAGSGVGAGIRAVTAVGISGVSLQNNGPVLTGTPDAPGAPASQSVSASAASAFPGLTLGLPRNPNGAFVVSRNASSRFLVESNPLFTSAGSTLGSDFLLRQLGLDADSEHKRLGDDSYEAYLIQQQLIAQTGHAMLNGQSNVADVYRTLMESAAAQAKGLDLSYGTALTPAQIANLTDSIVWMVETEVDGQKVLAPVVYLPPGTLASIERGAEIVAGQVTMEVTELVNTGGSIAGKDSVSITAQRDITNLSGSIQGGNVSVSSTEGSIRNQTYSQTQGAVGNMATTIGKTAGISATGNLSLDAARNIENIGAQMAAGGDASLNAGNNIVFDTIEDKQSTRHTELIQDGMAGGSSTTTTTSTTQVKSGLSVGGSLSAKAGNDVTFAGTDVNVNGDAQIDAGNNLNIVARENTTTTDSRSQVQGLGVGGGLYGTSETTSNAFSSRNVGSTFNVGGNADLSAGQTMVVQGSKVNVGGDTAITATDVQVLAGKDVDRTTTTTTTTSFLQIENVGDGKQVDGHSGAQAESDAGGQAGRAQASGSAAAGAAASAGASYANSAGVTLAKTTTTSQSSLSQRSVGSELNLGGNVKINAKETVTLQGSVMAATGDVELNARNVELLAAQNIEAQTYSSTTTRVGLYASTENQAEAGASASSQAEGTSRADAGKSQDGRSAQPSASAQGSASAQAEAGAEASSNNTVDVLRVDTQERESLKVTNTGSAIRSGGNMKINVQETLRTVGSGIEAEGDVDLKARDMSFEAAQDIEYSKESSSTSRLGMYLDASANAGANAQAHAEADVQASTDTQTGRTAGSANAEAGASAQAGVEVRIGVGIQAKDTRTTTEQGTSTAVTSAIVSRSGSVTRTAEGTIRDVGTGIEAAQDFTQSANRIESLAAQNSQFSRTTTEDTTARMGVFFGASASAEAEAGASASAQGSTGISGPGGEASAQAQANASAEAEVVQGLEASMERTVSSESQRSTQAVTSSIKAGGKVSSQSQEKTVLQGTQIQAGGEVELSAAELEVLAARNTEESTSSSETISARMETKVGLGASAEASAEASTEDGASTHSEAGVGMKFGVEAEAAYSKNTDRDASTTAVVAGIAGSKIKINTTGKTTLEGTQLDAGTGGIEIAAGSLDYRAARDTQESSSSSLSVDASMSLEGTVGIGEDIDAQASASTSVSNERSASSRAVVGAMNSAGGLQITTQGDTRLEGTQVRVAGDTSVAAGGSVVIDAARNTYQSSKDAVDVSAGFNKDEGSAELEVSVGGERERGSQAVVSDIATGGSMNISAGRNVSIEGAKLGAGGDAQVAAGGNVTFKEARDEHTASNTSVSVRLGTEGGEEEDEEADTRTASRSNEAGLDFSHGSSQRSQALTGSLTAGNNLTVVSGGDTTFIGTDLSAGRSAQVVAGGDVHLKAAESTHRDVSLGLSLGGSTDRSSTRALSDKDDTGTVETAETQETEGSANLNHSASTEQKGSNLSAGAGGIQVMARGNVALQGVQMQTDGTADIAAAGKVTQSVATRSSSSFGLDLSGGLSQQTSSEADKPDGAEATEERSSQSGHLQVSALTERTQTRIDATSGSTVRSNAQPTPSIPGVSMTLRGSVQSDGSLLALVPLLGKPPTGTPIQASLPDGRPVPDWITINPESGAVSGRPPQGYEGGMSLVFSVPQSDGSVKKIGVQF